MAEHFEQDGSKLYATGTWGSRSARLQLSADDRASPPADLLRTQAVVRRRMGIDQQPIDVATDHGTHLVQASVWADQADRLERVRAAIQEGRHDPPELLQGDYVGLLPTLLAQREDDALTVVFETASRLYLPVEARIRLRAAVEDAGAAGPLAWLATQTRYEDETGGEGYALELAVWPCGRSRVVARLGHHGQ